jgi:signal transduction histidine kinase
MSDSIPQDSEDSSLSYEEQLEALCSAHGIVLAIADSSGTCTFLNNVAYELLHIPADSAIGMKFSDLSRDPSDFWRAVHETASASIENNNRQYRELAFSTEGNELRFLCGCVPKIDKENESHQSYIVLINISGAPSASANLRDAEQQRDNVLAILSHELRNPLAALRSGLKIIELAPHSPQATKAVATMERQLMHVVRLVNDLLDVSRIQMGHLELKSSRTTVGEIVTLALEASGESIKNGRHTLNLSLPEEVIEVEGDLTRLAQVLTNLLDNASKYTPQGGAISLNTFTNGTAVVIEVSDSGVGVAANHIEEIFKAYSQVDSSRSLSRGGLGIGLYLVKKILEAHGGQIEVKSDGSGRGSTFRVTLPLLGAFTRP